MLYPEMPKSKRKSSYIVGGIFALLVGLIIFLLFLPSFLDKNFGFKPWDWNTIIPNMNNTFFGQVGFYLGIVLPVTLFLCAVASLFMGLSKSSGLFKGSVMASTLALILKHSLAPANFTSQVTNFFAYIEYALVIIALILAILATVFRFIGEEPYAPFRANSFHFYASYGLIVVTAFDVFAGLFGLDAIVANVSYYIGAVFGLFLIIAGIWMFCTSTRDPSEYGIGYERDAKINADKKVNQTKENAQTQSPQQNTTQQQETTQQQNTTPQQPRIGPDGKPLPPIPPRPPMPNGQPQPNMQQPNAQPFNAQQQNAQANMEKAPQTSGQAPQGTNRPASVPPKPFVGPNGTTLPPRPPMPPRIGPDGKPLPPMPPRQPMPNGQPQPNMQQPNAQPVNTQQPNAQANVENAPQSNTQTTQTSNDGEEK